MERNRVIVPLGIIIPIFLLGNRQPVRLFEKKKKKKKKREKKEKKGRETKKTREEKNERGNRWPNETLKNATNHSFFGLFVRYSDEEEFARNLVDARLETLNACLLALYITYARLLATCTLRYSL